MIKIMGYYMHRTLINDLITWRNQSTRMPLLLRGARQVGKTHLIERFGSNEFDNHITLNLEHQPEYKECFQTLIPKEILTLIESLSRQSVTPGKTLLFIDEIQECPKAILALRYFKENMPELHVISAGSLLEFTLNDPKFNMPVGRIESLYLKPLSFKEFLYATDNHSLVEFIETLTLQSQCPEVLHLQLTKLLRQYMVLGGMPAVIDAYLKNEGLRRCQILQSAILNTYRNDFGKYAPLTDHKYLQKLFEKAPGLIGQHLKYVKVDPDMQSRDIKKALHYLCHAGLIYQVFSTTASGLPLNALANEKRFKIVFLDVGLVNYSTHLEAEILLEQNLLLINQGAMAEQFVGQELLAYGVPYEPGHLFFWTRDDKAGKAEVDYIINVGSEILPLEVKSGTTGRLKSLKLFLEEKKAPLGIRTSLMPLSFEKNILSVPLYMISEIERLVRKF